jgi:hypothetical protein
MEPKAKPLSSNKPSKRAYSNVPDGEISHAEDGEDPLSSSSSPVNSNSNGGLRNNDSSNHMDDCEPDHTLTDIARPHISVDDAIDRLGMGKFQYRILVAAGLCFAADAMEVLLASFSCGDLGIELAANLIAKSSSHNYFIF